MSVFPARLHRFRRSLVCAVHAVYDMAEEEVAVRDALTDPLSRARTLLRPAAPCLTLHSTLLTRLLTDSRFLPPPLPLQPLRQPLPRRSPTPPNRSSYTHHMQVTVSNFAQLCPNRMVLPC